MSKVSLCVSCRKLPGLWSLWSSRSWQLRRTCSRCFPTTPAPLSCHSNWVVQTTSSTACQHLLTSTPRSKCMFCLENDIYTVSWWHCIVIPVLKLQFKTWPSKYTMNKSDIIGTFVYGYICLLSELFYWIKIALIMTYILNWFFRANASLNLEGQIKEVDGLVSGFEKNLSNDNPIPDVPNAIQARTDDIHVRKSALKCYIHIKDTSLPQRFNLYLSLLLYFSISAGLWQRLRTTWRSWVRIWTPQSSCAALCSRDTRSTARTSAARDQRSSSCRHVTGTWPTSWRRGENQMVKKTTSNQPKGVAW